MGWYFTFEISVIAMVLGISGCSTTGCWVSLPPPPGAPVVQNAKLCLLSGAGQVYLGFWIVVAAASIVTQFKVGVAEDMHEKEYVSSLQIFMHRFRTMFHTLMDLEDSMQKMSEYHSPEDRAAMLATNARVYAQVTTFMLDFTLMVSGIAGVVGVVEGLIRGNMPVGSFAGIVLTVCLILNFLAAILLSIFSIYIDNRPEGTDRKQLRVHYDRERPPPNS